MDALGLNITDWAIRNNRVTLAIVVCLVVSGLTAYIGLPKAQNPDFLIRTATITTFFPGASSQRVELIIK